jgi:hypothetical protein
MSINEMILKFHSYESFINEMAIKDEDINNKANFLKNFSDIKENLKVFKKVFADLKTSILSNDFKLKKLTLNGNTVSYEIKYDSDTKKLINLIEEAYEKAPNDIKHLYDKEVCPGSNLDKIRFEVIIQIQKNILNRIHVPHGFPISLQGLGLGKILYKKCISEFGYISTNRLDRTVDASMVWDSLRKEKDIYSFIIDEEMISFSSTLSYIEIEKPLLEFFKHKIQDKKTNTIKNDYILDSDFLEKYRSDQNFKNSDLFLLL